MKANLISLIALGLAIVAIVVSLSGTPAAKSLFGALASCSGRTVNPCTGFSDLYWSNGSSTGALQVNGLANLNGGLTSSGTVTLTGTFAPNSIGNGVLNLGPTSSVNLTAAQLCTNNIINMTPIVLTATLTMPTAAAIQATTGCLTNAGGSNTWFIHNTATATNNLSIVVGASSTIKWAALSSSTVMQASAIGGGLVPNIEPTTTVILDISNLTNDGATSTTIEFNASKNK